MRRRTVHAAYAALALACAAAAAVPGWRWWRLARVEAALAEAQRPLDPADAEALRRAVPPSRDAAPEVRLARASALARAGAYDAAFKGYGALVQDAAGQPAGRDALFNLGNMYLRQAMGLPPAGAAAGGSAAPTGAAAESVGPLRADAAPLVELAKQRYRDLLRLAPDDWDARYNLERALRLAPEDEPPAAIEPQVPAERRQVKTRGMDAGELP